ncbi:hypothetical protein BH11MYX3_BH11MYX3_01670 [soil metagenome]
MRAVLVVLAITACGHPPRTSTIQTTAPSEYPGVLHDPKTFPRDFMVRQTLKIHTQRDGQPVDAELDAVVQKQGDTLLIIGLGPMDMKAFTLTQKGDQIEFVQVAGPELPFSPRNIVVDVHRVFFKRLPAPAQPGYSGVQRGELDDERVEEVWKDGQLRAATFTRPGSKLKGAIRVQLGEGCTPVACEPVSAMLRNEWFGYTLTIANEGYETL